MISQSAANVYGNLDSDDPESILDQVQQLLENAEQGSERAQLQVRTLQMHDDFQIKTLSQLDTSLEAVESEMEQQLQAQFEEFQNQLDILSSQGQIQEESIRQNQTLIMAQSRVQTQFNMALDHFSSANEATQDQHNPRWR